ncbi:MAG: hypothetical protein CVV44_07860 [Spirochaetae bacterium HGW-Spirochaetae-1]|jgi:predicted Zn-dependent protease|nr:MAG: hypothetical protein CVV44_07860 [Spirochaetae bacterium HGW-Spirochaetae-1]
MNLLKYHLAGAMVKRSIKGSDFNPLAAEMHFGVDIGLPLFHFTNDMVPSVMAHPGDGKVEQ